MRIDGRWLTIAAQFACPLSNQPISVPALPPFVLPRAISVTGKWNMAGSGEEGYSVVRCKSKGEKLSAGGSLLGG